MDKEQLEEQKKIYSLKLHEKRHSRELSTGNYTVNITKVDSGWLYTYEMGGMSTFQTFVPFGKDYLNQKW